MRAAPISFDGQAIGRSTDYNGRFRRSSAMRRGAQVQFDARRDTAPTFQSLSIVGERLTLTLYRLPTAAVTAATFNRNVKQWFDPGNNHRGPRWLVVTGDDGTTEYRLPCFVESVTVRPEALDMYDIVLVSAEAFYEGLSDVVSGSNPATVTNGGNVAAAPVLALTTSTHVTRRACTVRGVGAGGGMTRRLIMFDINDSAMTSSNVFVFIEGVSVPCAVTGGGTSSSKVFAFVDTHSDGVTTTGVDVIYGAGLSNPLAGALDLSPWHTAAFSNAEWRWDTWACSTHPDTPGVWRPIIDGRHTGPTTIAYGITAESASQIGISTGTNPVLNQMDADSIAVLLGGVASGTLVGLSRVVTNNGLGYSQAFVRYRTATGRWITAWTSTANGTTTTSITITDAVAIMAGIRKSDPANNNAATVTLSHDGSYASVALTSDSQPTVVVGSATSMDLYNGTITIGSETITLAAVLVPDGTLTIDCARRSIQSSVDAAPIYGAFSFSAPTIWAHLEPGSNAIAHTLTGAALVVTHRSMVS